MYKCTYLAFLPTRCCGLNSAIMLKLMLHYYSTFWGRISTVNSVLLEDQLFRTLAILIPYIKNSLALNLSENDPYREGVYA